MNKIFDYVVHSTNEKCYNRLRCNLPHPYTNYSKMLVTTLTTVCRMLLIQNGDYITFNDDNTIVFNNDYANLDTSTFIAYFNKLMTNHKPQYIIAGIDNVERITIYSDKAFTITDMSYNLKLLFGLYNKNISKTEPLTAKEHPAEPNLGINPANNIDIIKSDTYYSIEIDSVGYTNSTPVMYLLSNIGEQCFRTIDQNLVSGMRVVMKINNSFSYGSPIIHPNSDFEVQLPSGDLTSLEFVLVDAYMHEVKLLSPMFLTIHVAAIDDEQLTPHPTTPTYNAPVYYDLIPRPHLKTKDEEKVDTFDPKVVNQYFTLNSLNDIDIEQYNEDPKKIEINLPNGSKINALFNQRNVHDILKFINQKERGRRPMEQHSPFMLEYADEQKEPVENSVTKIVSDNKNEDLFSSGTISEPELISNDGYNSDNGY